MSDAEESDCDTCDAYKKADQDLPAFPLCPHCGKEAFFAWKIDQAELKVIGTDNTDRGPFSRAPAIECASCRKWIYLKLEKLVWNANHDIYYPAKGGET